jgi:hypothetical protein
MSEKLDVSGDYVSLRAKSGYAEGVSLLATCKDNGNGYTFFFPTYSPCYRENYICMDYSEAAYAYKILKHFKKQGAFDE